MLYFCLVLLGKDPDSWQCVNVVLLCGKSMLHHTLAARLDPMGAVTYPHC
jgi:hypothetical protein